jgi:dihydrolipoamide dehydrogenase
LAVVGAGIIGLELGSVWSRLGSKVTVLEALDDFLPMTDKDISKESFKEFKKQGLDIQLSSKVSKGTKNLKKSVSKLNYEIKKEIEKEFEKLIVAVGRYPNSSEVL